MLSALFLARVILDCEPSVSSNSSTSPPVFQVSRRSAPHAITPYAVQGLKQADLYHFSSVSSAHVTISPVLKPLDIPVRATILPLLDQAAAAKVKAAVDSILLPVLPAGSIWRQNHKLYHSTLFHASSHVVRDGELRADLTRDSIDE